MIVASVLFHPPKRLARSHASGPAVREGGGRAMTGAWRAVSMGWWKNQRSRIAERALYQFIKAAVASDSVR